MRRNVPVLCFFATSYYLVAARWRKNSFDDLQLYSDWIKMFWLMGGRAARLLGS